MGTDFQYLAVLDDDVKIEGAQPPRRTRMVAPGLVARACDL